MEIYTDIKSSWKEHKCDALNPLMKNIIIIFDPPCTFEPLWVSAFQKNHLIATGIHTLTHLEWKTSSILKQQWGYPQGKGAGEVEVGDGILSFNFCPHHPPSHNAPAPS